MHCICTRLRVQEMYSRSVNGRISEKCECTRDVQELYDGTKRTNIVQSTVQTQYAVRMRVTE